MSPWSCVYWFSVPWTWISVIHNILVVTDHFTRYAKAYPARDQSASTVAKIFCEHYVVHYGLPAQIHSDQGWDFESRLIQHLLVKNTLSLHQKQLGTHLACWCLEEKFVYLWMSFLECLRSVIRVWPITSMLQSWKQVSTEPTNLLLNLLKTVTRKTKEHMTSLWKSKFWKRETGCSWESLVSLESTSCRINGSQYHMLLLERCQAFRAIKWNLKGDQELWKQCIAFMCYPSAI